MNNSTFSIPFQVSPEFLTSFEQILLKFAEEAVSRANSQVAVKPYMNKKEAAKYIGVSFNTFVKLEKMGLPIIEIDGIKLVSKQDIDEFLENHK